MEYDWDVSKQAVERLLQLRKPDRSDIIHCFDEICQDPFSFEKGICFELDGKPYYTITRTKFVITFTIDHPIQQIHILSIE